MLTYTVVLGVIILFLMFAMVSTLNQLSNLENDIDDLSENISDFNKEIESFKIESSRNNEDRQNEAHSLDIKLDSTIANFVTLENKVENIASNSTNKRKRKYR